MGASFPSVGAFTQATADAVTQAFTDINADFYVDGDYGYDGNPGTSPGLAFRTMTPLTSKLATFRGPTGQLLNNRRIVIAFSGVLSQQWTAPIINDVAIVGCGNKPRQATTSGVSNGGGATWLSPSNLSNTAALINVRGQAWRLENVFFNNSATGAPAVMLTVSGSGDPPTDPDASHAEIVGCVFNGTDDGLSSTGLPNFVVVDRCIFSGFAGAGDIAISYAVGAGVKTLSQWVISNNLFQNNVHNLIAGLANASIVGNTFIYAGTSVTSTSLINLTNGSKNLIWNNKFSLDSHTSAIGSTIIIPASGDSWGPNFYSDITEYGAPTS